MANYTNAGFWTNSTLSSASTVALAVLLCKNFQNNYFCENVVVLEETVQLFSISLSWHGYKSVYYNQIVSPNYLDTMTYRN